MEAAHLRRLPGRDVGTDRVPEDRKPSHDTNVHGRGHDGAAGSLHPGDHLIEAGGTDVHPPGGRLTRHHHRPDSRHVFAADLGHRVPAVLGVGRDLDIPSEEPGVEVPRRFGASSRGRPTPACFRQLP